MRAFPIDGRSARIQAKIDTGYAKAARVLGRPYRHIRAENGASPYAVDPMQYLPADFTNAKSSGFNYDRAIGPDDVLWHGLLSGRGLRVGDYLFEGADPRQEAETIYFVAAMPPLKPIVCVLCNRTISLFRGNSQIDEDGGQAEGLPSQEGGTGRYWGVTTDPDDDEIGPGEFRVRKDIPVALFASAGSARGQGQVPSDAPGPVRWKAYLPQSAFPKGSVRSRDTVTDDQGNRYQVMSDDWSPIGYTIEMIRLES